MRRTTLTGALGCPTPSNSSAKISLSTRSYRWLPPLPFQIACGCCLLAATLHPLNGRAQTVLTNGGSLDGSLAAGATAFYSVSATAGDKVILQVAKLSGGAGFTPLIELFAPDGTRLLNDSHALGPRADIQATVSGTYTVGISDVTRTGSGDYRVRLAQLPGAFTIGPGDEGGSLTNGVIHQGTIDLGDLDMWTISAASGDRIIVQIAELSGGAGFTPRIEIFAPDGTILGTRSGGVAARIDVQAVSGGTYTVLVRDSERGGTGTYQLQLAHLPGDLVVPAGDQGGALADETDADGAITTGDFDLWSFNADAGDRVIVQMTELTGGANFAPQIELFTPGGERKAVARGALGATLDAAIEASGSYILLVSDTDQIGAGSYRLRLSRSSVAPAESNTLSNGNTSSGSIATAGQTNRWSFTASAGESVVVRVGETASGAFFPWLRLYSPAGVLLGQDFNPAGAEVAVRATNSGTFVAVISDGSGGRNQTGNYRINLAKTGSPLTISASDEGGVLTNGTMYLASIDTGDIDAWTFTANIGETVVVRMGETVANSPLYPWLRLYGPDGVMLHQDFTPVAAEVTARATNSGTFLIVVGDGNNGFGGTGNYRLSLARTGSQPVISPTDEGGSLTNGTTHLGSIDTGDIDSWTFVANAGETVLVRMGETAANSPLYPWLRLYGPNGALLHQEFSPAAAEVTTRATNSGTFTLIVGDANNGFSGTGNYRLSLAKTGSQPTISSGDDGGPLVNGTTYLGTIDVGDIDAWTIAAEAGETILVRMGETAASSPLYTWLRLYGPNGALLNQDFSPAAAEVITRATNGGTFLVIVGDANNGIGGSGNYRLSLAKTGSQPAISPTDEGGPVANGSTYVATIDVGDVDAWTFAVNAGETIVARMGETAANGPLYPWLRLYGPNGVFLGQDFSPAAAEVTLRATNSGTFLLVVADGNNGIGGTGNYRLSLTRTTGPIFISPGDEGGSMMGAGEYVAAIETGDLDAWAFTACVGDVITLSVTESVSGSLLYPWLRLYGTDGALLRTVSGPVSASVSNLVATTSGTYVVVVSDGNNGIGGSGNYRLAVNGLTDGLKLCPPKITGTNAVVTGIGGAAGGPFTLLTAVEVDMPLNLWTVIRTNQFDFFGLMSATNAYSTQEPHRFFILQVP